MDAEDRSFGEETARVSAMIKRARNYSSGLSAIGQCHNCGEDIAPGKLYCDNHCADDHAKSRSRRGLAH